VNLGDSYCNAGSRNNGTGLDGNRRGGMSDTDGSWAGAKDTYRDIRHALKAEGVKHKDLIGIPWAVAFALRAEGWYLRQEIIWHKPNPMPDGAEDRPTRGHEQLFLFSKRPTYFYDAEAVAEKAEGKSDNYFGSRAQVGTMRNDLRRECPRDWETRNKRSVWTVPVHSFPGAHFATFPPDLIEPCILAGSRPGDLVLDPFNGSGTTGAEMGAAVRRGGVERGLHRTVKGAIPAAGAIQRRRLIWRSWRRKRKQKSGRIKFCLYNGRL
jgi:hypothetical protein